MDETWLKKTVIGDLALEKPIVVDQFLKQHMLADSLNPELACIFSKQIVTTHEYIVFNCFKRCWWLLFTRARARKSRFVRRDVCLRRTLGCHAPIRAAVKKNKIGAVVISVFDWYRTLDRFKGRTESLN